MGDKITNIADASKRKRLSRLAKEAAETLTNNPEEIIDSILS